jgi:hypothetical protein
MYVSIFEQWHKGTKNNKIITSFSIWKTREQRVWYVNIVEFNFQHNRRKRQNSAELKYILEASQSAIGQINFLLFRAFKTSISTPRHFTEKEFREDNRQFPVIKGDGNKSTYVPVR